MTRNAYSPPMPHLPPQRPEPTPGARCRCMDGCHHRPPPFGPMPPTFSVQQLTESELLRAELRAVVSERDRYAARIKKLEAERGALREILR